MNSERASLRPNGGFTLLEVMVALAVVSLGLIAVFNHWDTFLTDLGAAIARFGLLGRLVFAAFTVNLATQILKGTSDFLASYWYIPAFGLMALVLIHRAGMRNAVPQ